MGDCLHKNKFTKITPLFYFRKILFWRIKYAGSAIIILGIDEKAGYKVCGIQNPDELIKKVVEQANEMEPKVRSLISFCEYEGKIIASAEIAEMDLISKPCYYSGKGKSKGSYIRVGEADLPMTEYESFNCN